VSWHIDTANALPPLAEPGGTAAAFELLEARLPIARRAPPDGPIRVLAWRADAEPSPDDAARLLRTSEAAVAMLAMRETVAASGCVGALAAVASRLGAGHAAALLDAASADGVGIVADSVGLVSGHVLFKLGLERLPAARLPSRGGSPCAVIAQLDVDRVNVTFASVALDPGDGPDQRGRQILTLLDRIDHYDRYLPVLIGGDMATTTFTPEELADAGRMRLLLRKAEQRLLMPAPHEPLFHVLRQRGYDWRSVNVPLAPTGRDGPPGAGRDQLYKRLWFFARGLICDEPAVVPALDGSGQPMGSHDAITVQVRPA
jgi:hypothetical protein